MWKCAGMKSKEQADVIGVGRVWKVSWRGGQKGNYGGVVVEGFLQNFCCEGGGKLLEEQSCISQVGRLQEKKI